MACERYREELAELAAGASPRPATEGHLAACEACRAELDDLRRALAAADAALLEWATAEPSPALRARIRRSVEEDAGAHSAGAGWRLAWAAALAASVLAAVLLVTWRLGSRGPGAPPLGAAVATAPERPGIEEAEANAWHPVVAATPAPRPAATGRRAEASSSASHRSSRIVAAAAGEPEVLVPPGGTEALVRFASHLQRRTIPPDSLLVADLQAPLAEPAPVEIKPLEIVPLDPAEGSGT
jgi:hypothetical protein